MDLKGSRMKLTLVVSLGFRNYFLINLIAVMRYPWTVFTVLVTNLIPL